MPSPSPEIIRLLSIFAVAFTAPTFTRAMVLVCGAILAPGRRTVTAALRVMGLGQTKNFGAYHRVLSRAKWSPWLLSKLLLAELISSFLSPGAPLVLAVDDTLERRKGRKLSLRGWFRDPLRSSGHTTSKVSALRWVCLSIVVPVPWGKRQWALPFMTIPAPSKKTCDRLARRHKSPVELASLLITVVRHWQPRREMLLLADGAYAALKLVQDCQKLGVTLISRLRIDACLYDFPTEPPPSKRGPKAKKGARQPSPTERLEDPLTVWTELDVSWYGGETKRLEVATGASLWHRSGFDPVAICWVLLRCPEQSFSPCAFFASCDIDPQDLLARYVSRWNLEVAFEEMRAQLGFETARQWSDRAVSRTTPCLFGLFSLVVLLAKRLHPEKLPIQQCIWYHKSEASFADALAAVRLHLWTHNNYHDSSQNTQVQLIPQPLWNTMVQTVCYST